MTIRAGMQPSDATGDGECVSSPPVAEQLLPGIPNDITLGQIVPKLPWRAFHILSAVSPAWLHANRSRRVHKARVHSHSTEPLVIVTYDIPGGLNHAIALYSMRDKSCLELPPIPDVDTVPPLGYEVVALDGKIYVLGGMAYSEVQPESDTVDEFHQPGSDVVYVFDVAGQREWSHCASMTKPRTRFGCGVMNGKIYVFGGVSSSEPVSESEVYDPEKNSWSRIRPMISLRFNHSVDVLGQEFFVSCGSCFDRNYYNPATNRMEMLDRDNCHLPVGYNEIYNPVKDEWRVIKLFPELETEWDRWFFASGNWYSQTDTDIYILDADWDSFTLVHSSKIIVFERGIRPSLIEAQAMHGELLATMCWDKHGESFFCLAQSKGFGGKNKRIVWERVPFFLPSANMEYGYLNKLYPIQL